MQTNIEIVEDYFNALKDKDLTKMPLSANVSFEDPLTPKLTGKDSVLEFLNVFLPAIKGVVVKQHISEGEFVATLWEADTSFGLIPIFECFRVSDGEITEIKAFLDPRPITNPTL